MHGREDTCRPYVYFRSASDGDAERNMWCTFSLVTAEKRHPKLIPTTINRNQFSCYFPIRIDHKLTTTPTRYICTLKLVCHRCVYSYLTISHKPLNDVLSLYMHINVCTHGERWCTCARVIKMKCGTHLSNKLNESSSSSHSKEKNCAKCVGLKRTTRTRWVNKYGIMNGRIYTENVRIWRK